ncbi:LysE family translocator [Rhizobium laguerreae]|uniref:LysE family translocator n=1 Tax=Rhizobium laguerreae TaxID=1076926 RepID=UPI003AB979BF
MTPALLFSIAAFSLAASISPGPVNIVAMSAGMRHGFVRSMWFVTGATIGFVVLLVFVGFGLSAAISCLPNLLAVVRWAGVLFLIYMAVGLATDGGAMSPGRTGMHRAPWMERCYNGSIQRPGLHRSPEWASSRQAQMLTGF